MSARPSRLSFPALFIALGLASLAGAQTTFRATQWTAENGLPQNSVRGISQTSDGYLWIATLNGLARFDGVRFTVFDKSNTPGMTSNRLIVMARGEGDELWLLGEDANVIRFDSGHVDRPGAGVAEHAVAALTTDNRGGIWVTSGGRVLKWDRAARGFVPETFSDNEGFAPLWWPGTGFWTLRGRQLRYFARGALHTRTLPDTFPLTEIGAVAVGADDVVWIRLAAGRHARLAGDQVLYGRGAIETRFTGTRPTWKASIDATLQRRLLVPSDGRVPPIHYNVIRTDNEGNAWVGSETEGLFRIQPQSIRTYSTAQGLAGDNVYPVLESRAGGIWVGTWPAGLSRISDDGVVTYTARDGVPGLVSALAEDPDGRLWVGSHGGLVTFRSGAFAKPPGIPADLPTVQAILQRRDGSMLLGTPKGVYVSDGVRSRWLTAASGLAVDDARVIVEARGGDVWIGGYGGLTRLRGERFDRWTEATGLPAGNVRAVYEDDAGDVWVGTYDGGIGRFRQDRWATINRTRGLFDNGVFQILEDARHTFWISSNRGIYRVSKQELNEVADGTRERVESVAYGRSDGMRSIECNGGLWPAGARDARGRLWFPTQGGVAVIDPETLVVVTQPPRVAIESVTIDGVDLGPVDHVTLRPGQASLVIDYTALSYSKPDQIAFRYVLDGVDRTWQDVGPRRAAQYSHLPPGRHLFRLTAQNSDGVRSAGEQTLAITVIPPFYERWWFFGAIGATAVGSVLLLMHYRVTRLLQKQAAQQAFAQQLIASQEHERRRIAGDLHDGLGQRLIVINNLARLLMRTPAGAGRDDERVRTLEEISTEAAAAIDETRTISYALHPFQLERLGLTRAIQAMVTTAARASSIAMATDLADIDDAFPASRRIDVFRIVQEGVNNIVKHSHASTASIVITRRPDAVLLTIEDDGTGIAAGAGRQGPGGFGMTGLRERARLLRGTLRVASEPGHGTRLVFEFPTGPADV